MPAIRCGHCGRINLVDTKAKKSKFKEPKEEKKFRNILQVYLQDKLKEFEKELNAILASPKRRTIMHIKAAPRKNVYDAIDEMNRLAKGTKNIMEVGVLNELLNQVIRGSYLTGLDEISAQVDINFFPNMAAVDFIAKYSFKQVKDMNDEIANDLQDIFERSLMEGADIRTVKKRIQEKFDVGIRRSETIARSEYSRAFGEGKKQAMFDTKNMGITGLKYWDAFYKNIRTSEMSNALHEKYSRQLGRGIPADQPFKIRVEVGKKKKRILEWEGYHTHQPNDRCTQIFVPISEEKLRELCHPDYREYL